jgi:hypothetical protein
MQHHVQIEKLDADLVADGSASHLMLAIQGLTVVLSHEGLATLLRALIPEEPVQSRIIDEPNSDGCRIQLQATRLGFNARIVLRMKPDTSTPGAILINVDPYNGWSPLDRVMLGIAVSNLDKVARLEPVLQRVRSGVYRADLQGFIRKRLLDSNAPLRWDARLETIEGSQAEIRVFFASMIDAEAQ